MSQGTSFDPFASLVRLGHAGPARIVSRKARRWPRLTFRDGDRIVGALRGRGPADVHADHWEMHPAGDELLVMLSGEVDLFMQQRPRDRRIRLREGRAFIVPRGLWHRFVVCKPFEMLFCTPARGSRHKPVAG
jgi:mannose-6-phosphate isomerase-like protein (cupin superfamily)